MQSSKALRPLGPYELHGPCVPYELYGPHGLHKLYFSSSFASHRSHGLVSIHPLVQSTRVQSRPCVSMLRIILTPRPRYSLATPVRSGLGCAGSVPLTRRRNCVNGVRAGSEERARCWAFVLIAWRLACTLLSAELPEGPACSGIA